MAYYECVHEVKLIVDLIFEGGIERMHYSISDTAEYGSIAVGPRVVDAHVKENMKKVLGAIQDGSFAEEWIAEMDKGSPSLVEARRKLAATQVEEVGKRLRALVGQAGGGAWRRLTSRSPCSGYGTVGSAVNRLLNEQAGRHRARHRAPAARGEGARSRPRAASGASRPAAACSRPTCARSSTTRGSRSSPR